MMKRALLTDEEIQVVFDAFLREHPEAQWDSIMMCQAQNKAQLKKVVDMLQECDGDLVSRDNKPFMATFEMLAEDWEALLKEIK